VSIEAMKLVVTSNKKISLVMGSSGISHRASWYAESITQSGLRLEHLR
jgi:hypothetical protein